MKRNRTWGFVCAGLAGLNFYFADANLMGLERNLRKLD